MIRLDTILIGIVALVWSLLAIMYATVPAILMPPSYRVWGAGAVVFIILTLVMAIADKKRK